MQCLLFTKIYRRIPPERFDPIANELEFDSLDVLARFEREIESDRPQGMLGVVRRLRSLGLAVPATLTDIDNPAMSLTEQILGACAETQVENWFDYVDGRTAWVTTIRPSSIGSTSDPMRWSKWHARFGVRVMIQPCDDPIHVSDSLTTALLCHLDLALIGAYMDPRNQAVQDEWEIWALTFDLLVPWIYFLEVKNGAWRRTDRNAAGRLCWR